MKSVLFDWSILFWWWLSNSNDAWAVSGSSGNKKNLSEAWKPSRILRLHCRVNVMIFGTMLAKLWTFSVPKAGRRATFGSGRNSAKFWRHSAMSGLGSCTPCLFILYVVTRGIWRGNWSIPKTHQITQGNAENSRWVNFIYLAVHKMNYRKETLRFEVFMEHFPRSVESAVTTVSK